MAKLREDRFFEREFTKEIRKLKKDETQIVSKKRKLDLSDQWIEGKITTEEFLIKKERPFLTKKVTKG